MRVLMSGASGLLGTAIGRALEANGAVVTRLVRAGSGSENQIGWGPGKPLTLTSSLDAVIHLAGESVGGGGTTAKKAGIRGSRGLGGRALGVAGGPHGREWTGVG